MVRGSSGLEASELDQKCMCELSQANNLVCWCAGWRSPAFDWCSVLLVYIHVSCVVNLLFVLVSDFDQKSMCELNLANNLAGWCARWRSSAFDWCFPRTLFSRAAKTHAWPALLILLLLLLGEVTCWQRLLTICTDDHYLRRHILVFCG